MASGDAAGGPGPRASGRTAPGLSGGASGPEPAEAAAAGHRSANPAAHGDAGPGGGAEDPAAARPNGVVDRAATVVGRRPGPFAPRQLARLDEALTMSSRETGLDFSVYVGGLDEPTREAAERLHAGLGAAAPETVLVAVSPGQRVVHVVTGELSARRLPDRACALAVLSMEASFSGGDLVGGVVNGLRMLSDQAGRLSEPGGGER